jgi:hypothetical protein
MAKLRCIITGELRNRTPEEIVRQQFVKYLLDYGYQRDDIVLNFTAKFGCKSKYVDVAVFRKTGPMAERYQQKNIMFLAEMKREGISAKLFEDAKDQMFSYASSCTNCMFCAVFDGSRFEVFRKGYIRDMNGERGDWTFVSINALPPPEQVELPLPPATLWHEQKEPRASLLARGASVEPLPVSMLAASKPQAWTLPASSGQLQLTRLQPAMAWVSDPPAMGLTVASPNQSRPTGNPVAKHMTMARPRVAAASTGTSLSGPLAGCLIAAATLLGFVLFVIALYSCC